MSVKVIGFFLPAILAVLVQVSGLSATYRGAVVEYHPFYFEGNDELTLKTNLENYIKYIQEASKKNADIIVFPESGLYSKKLHPIPDPTDNIIPCDSADFVTTPTVKSLSCASKNNKIYTVVNLLEERKCEPDDKDCPSVGYYKLNTNVVFDRRGMVIARYSKFNLYDEGVDRLRDPEIVFFDTDFGVRFGTFICFDIMFPYPALKLHQQYKITDFVFSAFWFSEVPFLTALQMQRGWAETNNVNLLASGVNYPALGSAGSGIYNGKYGHIVQSMPEENTSQLLIADIPKISDNAEFLAHQFSTPILFETPEKMHNSSHFIPAVTGRLKDSAGSELALLRDQMKLFSSEVISHDKENFAEKICSYKDFCCEFKVVKDALTPQSKNYSIRAVVFNGVRKFGKNFRGGVQVCAVVVCEGPEIMNCTNRMKNISGLFKFKEINIKGNFNARNAFRMPTTLTVSKTLTPLSANKYEFTKIEKNTKTEVSLELLWPVIDLQTFGIWGRDFTRDMEPEVPESGASEIVSVPVLLGSFMAFILFAR